MLLTPLSFLRVSDVAVPGAVSAVDYGTELNSTGDPAAPELVSVCGVGAALHWSSGRPGQVGSLPSPLAGVDVKLNGSTFTHAPFDIVWVVPGSCSLVDEGMFTCVAAINEAIPALHVKPLKL